MGIRVTGILKTPMDAIMKEASIRVSAVITTDDVLACTRDEVITGTDGSYDFNLLEGTFDIEVNGKDEYCFKARVVVDGVTTSPITLPGLVVGYPA